MIFEEPVMKFKKVLNLKEKLICEQNATRYTFAKLLKS